ncbi:MAG: hypothetical protein Q9172_003415 [Xanthocarpia lactea]
MADQPGSGNPAGYEFLEKTRKVLVDMQKESAGFWDENWPTFLNDDPVAKNNMSQISFCNDVMRLVEQVSNKEIKYDEEAERRGEKRQQIVGIVGPYNDQIKKEKEKLEKQVEEEKAKKGDGNQSAA